MGITYQQEVFERYTLKHWPPTFFVTTSQLTLHIFTTAGNNL